MEYKVTYVGWYIVEAETVEEALKSSRDDLTVEYEEWENIGAVRWEDA